MNQSNAVRLWETLSNRKIEADAHLTAHAEGTEPLTEYDLQTWQRVSHSVGQSLAVMQGTAIDLREAFVVGQGVDQARQAAIQTSLNPGPLGLGTPYAS